LDLRPSIEEAVEKMLGCGDPSRGHAEYRCFRCGEKRVVAFSCKGRFCPSCGKKYVDDWVERNVASILFVGHRHYVYTIPEEFRSLVYWNREFLTLLADVAARVTSEALTREALKAGASPRAMPGIMTVVHTFGRDLAWNPHVHCLVTEGQWDDEKGVWYELPYVSYGVLRKKWQCLLSRAVREKVKKGGYTREKQREVSQLVNDLYARYPEGFYVSAARRLKSARGATRYIGRYLGRPAIADWRIEEYDGQTVTFRYDSHRTGKTERRTLPVEKFIGALVMHIAPADMKMARHYGLYSRRGQEKKKRAAAHLSQATQRTFGFGARKSRQTWRERIIESFGRDPLWCSKCNQEMDLWCIWHPDYGYLFSAWANAPPVSTSERERDGEARRPQRQLPLPCM
jgi:hypothetical protein